MKASDFSSVLSQFSETAALLNRESDSVNSILSDLQQRISDANVGIEVWLREALVSSDTSGSGAGARTIRTWTSHFLGFAKVESEWCLAVKPVRFETGCFEGDTNCPYQEEYSAGAAIRLASAPREIRMAALEKIPALIELLTEKAQRYIETINAAKALAG